MASKKKEEIENYLKRSSNLGIDFKEKFGSKRLSFAKVNKENYKIIYEMFKNDKNPFIDNRFKNLMDLDIYFHETLSFNLDNSLACDWLIFKNNSNEAVGVFHLCDFSRETVNNRNKRCTIGFGINPKFRRQYHATEAVMRFSEYIFNELKMEKIIANTAKDNYYSKKLFESLSFTNKTEDYIYSVNQDFYELSKEMFVDFEK